MRILPAVDIRDGRCVNLVQGDYDRETVFAEDPIAQAICWREQGGELIHIVDLDGAREGCLCVGSALQSLNAAGIPFQVGGGIRTLETVAEVLDSGAQRAIIGTAAFRDREFLRAAVERHPGRIAVAIDAKAGRLALSAWREETEMDALAFAREVERTGAARIIYTDILSDGMMKGPNLEMTRAVAEAVSLPVTASGGMASLEDIRRVASLGTFGVDEVIIGRALYLRTFSLQEAIETARTPT